MTDPRPEDVDAARGLPRRATPALVTLAVVGGLVSSIALFLSGTPGSIWTGPTQASSLGSVVVFVALTAGGLWILRRASRSAWWWAAVLGAVAATAEVAGAVATAALTTTEAHGAGRLGVLSQYTTWAVVQWVGTAWFATAAIAALMHVVDRLVERRRDEDEAARARPGVIARFVARLNDPAAGPRWISRLCVAGVLVVSRIPYLLVWWPGIVYYDTLRSYSMVRGTSPWSAFEPVGDTIRIGVMQWLGTTLGWGDAGGVALAVIGQILLDAVAGTLLLTRLPAWGLGRRWWVASFAWLALSPLLALGSIVFVKDVPFTSFVTIFAVAIGELLFVRRTRRRWWPWITLVLGAVGMIVMRSNGVYVALPTLLLLLIPLRRLWKPMLASTAVVLVAFGVYSGPVSAVLHVQPGRAVETYSVPVQQMALIARVHGKQLTPAERAFLTKVFDGHDPEKIAKHYVPALSDPMKLAALHAFAKYPASELLAGWAQLAAHFPATAAEATLANTLGWWDPGSAPYQILPLESNNDVRRIHLDIPSGPPAGGLQKRILDSGVIPTFDYWTGTANDGFFSIAVVGRLLSPGFLVWLWIVAAAVVIRRRQSRSLAVFIPYGMLLLTLLAGPVVTQRYAMPFAAGLPLALAALLLTPAVAGLREKTPVAVPDDTDAPGKVTA